MKMVKTVQKTMKSKVEVNTLDKVRIPLGKTAVKNAAKQIFEMLSQMPEITSSWALNKTKCQQVSFEISFCSDKIIQEINREYRDKDKTTDVITFALFADDNEAILCNKTAELGEIIISVETLVKQAQENNNTTEKELQTLITHGILHLLGFDHLEQKDYDFVVGIQNIVVGNL